MPTNPTDVPPLTIGDPLPNMILPDGTNNGVGLSQQNRAGRWQVLVFLEAAQLAAQSEAIADARRRLEAIEGMVFAIALCPPDPSMAGVDLFDETGNGARFLFGQPKPGIAAISPEPRLSGQFGVDQLEQAVAHCETAYKTDKPVVHTNVAPVLMINEVIESALRSRIVAFWNGAPKTHDEVASKRMGNEAEYASIKRRTDATIPDGELFSDIRHRISRRVIPIMERAFRIKVASMEALRVGCYSADNQGAFGRHRDNTTPYTAHRRFAMTLNLNTGDYEGGSLRFPEYGRALYQPPAGGAAIFSCSLLHEALPVTKGERMAMFSFFTDAMGLEQEKAMRQRMQAEQGKQA